VSNILVYNRFSERSLVFMNWRNKMATNGPQVDDSKKDPHPDAVTLAPVNASIDVSLGSSPTLTPALNSKKVSDPALKAQAKAAPAPDQQSHPASHKKKGCCALM
jgi:hypothetical protein